MSNDMRQNLMEDAEDAGLKAVMGKRFQDVSKEIPKQERKAIPQSRCSYTREPLSQETEGALDVKWVPENTVSPMDKVKACVKWTAVFGSVSAVLFYWQQAGLLDSRAAVPSLIFCALGAGLSIGWNAR